MNIADLNQCIDLTQKVKLHPYAAAAWGRFSERWKKTVLIQLDKLPFPEATGRFVLDGHYVFYDSHPSIGVLVIFQANTAREIEILCG